MSWFLKCVQTLFEPYDTLLYWFWIFFIEKDTANRLGSPYDDKVLIEHISGTVTSISMPTIYSKQYRLDKTATAAVYDRF